MNPTEDAPTPSEAGAVYDDDSDDEMGYPSDASETEDEEDGLSSDNSDDTASISTCFHAPHPLFAHDASKNLSYRSVSPTYSPTIFTPSPIPVQQPAYSPLALEEDLCELIINRDYHDIRAFSLYRRGTIDLDTSTAHQGSFRVCHCSSELFLVLIFP